ncbi:unnamed protein product [Wuchereria bancrofti]|uniref:Uncharacterized protein n=2 Tax=Wuchereria bancrofti TaxID=6293 RepID=A0A3P7DN83_WUCBA|nr:unnamed protein product [Wuchereria bancrofti]
MYRRDWVYSVHLVIVLFHTECIEQVNRRKGFVMGFQWFLLLLFSFVCDWLFTNGDDNLKEINDKTSHSSSTKLLGPVIQKNRVAEAVGTWIAATTENVKINSPQTFFQSETISVLFLALLKDLFLIFEAFSRFSFAQNTSNMTVTSRAPLQHVASSVAVTWIAQVVPAQASARQVILTSTVRQQLKQERHDIQTLTEFAARLSRLQAFNGFDEFDEAEDTHFLYYIPVFCAIIVCVYVASHNKKKILGFITEGRRPSNSTRRTALRYKRLSRHDHSSSDLQM